MSARDELRKYVHLLGDSWTPRSKTDERVECLYATVAAEVLREAAEDIEAIDAHPNARARVADIYRALGIRLRERANDIGSGGAV